jgi:type I restriction enzyme S subunit
VRIIKKCIYVKRDVRNVGYFRKVYRPKFDGVCSTDIWVIDSKGQFDNGFLFYFLADQRIINEASNSSEGTRMPRARWDYLSRLKFAFPTIGEQRAIASILSSLDDEIALNRSMNSTLEAIGQALFRRWFIDFEFPNKEGKPYRSSGGEVVEMELGEVPAGWRAGTLGELCDIIMGQSPPGTMKLVMDCHFIRGLLILDFDSPAGGFTVQRLPDLQKRGMFC